MNIKVAIQCVPERVKQVQRIESYIKKIGLECRHYMDFDKNGTIWNFNRIINDLSYTGTSHLLFLQDDVSQSRSGGVNEVMCFRSNAEGIFNGSANIDVRYPASRDNDVHRDLATHCLAEIRGWNKPTTHITESGDSE